MLGPLVDSLPRDDIRLVPVVNHFFGGNIGVSGLLTGTDLVDVLSEQPEGHRYLLPDSCLSEGRFLDDLTVADLPATRRGGPHRRPLPPPGARRPDAGGLPGRVPVALGASR